MALHCILEPFARKRKGAVLDHDPVLVPLQLRPCSCLCPAGDSTNSSPNFSSLLGPVSSLSPGEARLCPGQTCRSEPGVCGGAEREVSVSVTADRAPQPGHGASTAPGQSPELRRRFTRDQDQSDRPGSDLGLVLVQSRFRPEDEASGEREDEEEESVPIMHWEELSARIEELERQEQSKHQGAALRRAWCDDHEEDKKKKRLSSRLQKNLQLCFYNDEDSEDEDGAKGKVPIGCGLKQEVVLTLRKLRDTRLAELRRETTDQVQVRWVRLVRSELEQRTVQDLQRLRTGLQKDTQDLSAGLVSVLLIRDQLRTKQEALLLDLLDLT
ncbi:hypothetical protein WMY93_007445 [Mugilogobius chulae]|uniref:Schwannomin interacting protein 1 C-terminal domain-containing protein n=1 Tax=Mugilogobius chulae TaxID=88201 RepID=A0AAW0PGP9_9GOBI